MFSERKITPLGPQRSSHSPMKPTDDDPTLPPIYCDQGPTDPPPRYDSTAPTTIRQATQRAIKRVLSYRSFHLIHCTGPVIIKSAVVLSIMGIIFGIFFGCIYPTILDRGAFVETECRSLNFTQVSSRCCDITGCSCSECPFTLYVGCDASTLINQPLNNSYCCGDSQCCQQCCDTCSSLSCTGSGSSRHCATTYYSCNCRCCSSVSRRTCSFVCGICNSFTIHYVVDATNHEFDQSLSCARDDFQCVETTQHTYGYGQSWTCSYDSRNENNVRFNGGVPPWNVAAWVFFALFCLILFVLLSWWCAIPLVKFLLNKFC